MPFSCIDWCMKTTIDFPDDLLVRAKIAAAQRKTSLREMVVQGVNYIIDHDHSPPDEKAECEARATELLELMKGIQIAQPVGKWDRSAGYDRQGV
jgi:hypothetical protein